jgi:hypothetical protein
MNHQPYEDWLFLDEPLSPHQSRELKKHLQVCDSCTQLSESWVDIQDLIQSTPDVNPQAGFSARWLTRLQERENKTQQKQSWIMLIITGGVATFILLLMGINVILSVDQPLQLLFLGTNKVAEWLLIINATNEILSAFVELVSIIVPPGWWVMFAVVISLLSLLWIYSLKQLIKPRRMTI